MTFGNQKQTIVDAKPNIENENIQQKHATATSVPRKSNSTLEEGQKDQDQEVKHVYSDLENECEKLYQEYKNENEKEIPAHLSVIIYQCIHPLQDAVQDEFSNSRISFNDTDQQQNQQNHQAETLLQHQQEYVLEVYEYLVVLEQLTQPFSYNPQNEEFLNEKNSMSEHLTSDHKDDLCKRILLVRQNTSDDEEEKIQEKLPTFIRQSHEQILETTPSDKLSLSTKQFNVTIQEEEEKNEEQLIFDKEKQTADQTNYKTGTSNLLKGSIEVHCDYRQWITLKKEKQQHKKMQNSLFVPNQEEAKLEDKQEILQTSVLHPIQDKYSSFSNKQYRLSMWRLDKQKLTKLIIAEQTIIINENHVDVINDKFCFSVDKELIHITFQNGLKIEKTICFKSIDLSFTFEINHKNVEQKKEGQLSDPVMFFDTEENNYGMYFQDKEKGYFSYDNSIRNSSLNLILKKDFEEITNVFFGINDKKEQIIIFSKVLKDESNIKEFKIQLIPFNEKHLLDEKNAKLKKYQIEKKDQNKTNLISLDSKLQNFINYRAFYHPRYGIFLEDNSPQDKKQQEQKILIYITNFNLDKNDSELKIYKFDYLKIPMNAQCKSKLSMKCKYQQIDYLFLFDDFIECKGSLRQLYDNGQLFKIPNRQSQIDLEQFSDFIVSIEKTAQVYELNITDIKINLNNKHVMTPIINFISHDFLNQRQQLMQGYQQNLDEPDYQTLCTQAQNVYYNEPFIFEVINQITLNIYCTLDSKKNYSYQLKNHFECFLEFQEQEFLLPNLKISEKNRILYRHQMCMMITYDLNTKSHIIEIIVMPSYQQMPQGQFKIMTLPYKLLDFFNGPGSIQNSLVTGHYHQLERYKENNETVTQSYDALVLQSLESIIQINLPGTEHEDSDTLHNFQQIDIRSKSQLINLKMLKADIQQGKLFDNLQENFSKKELRLQVKKGIRFYLMLIPHFNDQNIQNGFDLKFIEITGHQNHPKSFKNGQTQIISYNPAQQNIEILQYALVKDNLENLFILTFDNQCLVTKYKIEYKNKKFQLIQQDKTIPNEKAEKEWSKVFQSINEAQQNFNMKFKNLNQIEIVLTDEGVYFGSMFFQNIYQSNKKKESMLEFEESRDSNISSIFSAEKEKLEIDLNIPGALQSPDQTSLLFSICRCKERQTNMLPQPNISKQNRSYTMRQKSLQSTIQMQVISHKKSHKGFYFLSIPIVTSKSKQLMPLEKFSKKVEYSTFLGNSNDNKNDDILVKLESDENSLGFLIFSKSGELRRLEDQKISKHLCQESHKDQISKDCLNHLNKYEVVQFLPCTRRQNLMETRDQLNLQNQIEQRYILKEFQETDWQQEQTDGKALNSPEIVMKILLRKENYIQILNISKLNNNYFIDSHFDQIQQIYKDINIQGSLKPICKLQANLKYCSIHLIRFIFFCPEIVEISERDVSKQKSRKFFLFIDQQQSFLKDQSNKNDQEPLNLNQQDSEQVNGLDNFIQDSIKYYEKNNSYQLKKFYQQMNEKGALLSQKRNSLAHQKDKADIFQYKDEDFEILILPQFKLQNLKQRFYLIFKIKNQINYVLIEKDLNSINFQVVEKTQQKIQIQFREPGYITQMLQVQRDDQLQIMYFEKDSGNFYLLLWSLQRNQEISLQTFKTSNANPFFQIFKGTQIRENYLIYVGSQYIQDLRLDFPQNFLSGKFAWNGFYPKDQKTFSDEELLQQVKIYKDELKISFSSSSLSLGLVDNGKTQVQRSYSYINLQYINYLLKRFSPSNDIKEDSKSPIILERLSIYLPFQNNILHYFATNKQFLELYLKEIPAKVNYQDSHNDSSIVYAYYPLIPNCLSMRNVNLKGRRPFSIALKEDNIPCFEVILQMLMRDSQKCYMNSIKQSFKNLLEQKSDIIFEFLEHHTTRFLYVDKRIRKKKGFQCKKRFINFIKNTDNMQSTLNPTVSQYYFKDQANKNQKRKWYNSCYLCCIFNSRYCCKKDKAQFNHKTKTDIILNSNAEKILDQNLDIMDNETYSDDEYDRTILSYQQTKRFSVSQNKPQYHQFKELYSYDFDGFLYGQKANEFLNFIIENKENIRIFDISYVEVLISYQWRKSFCEYVMKEIFFNLMMIGNFIIILFISSKLNCTNPNDVNECTNEIFVTFRKSTLWDSTQYTLFMALLPTFSFFIIFRLIIAIILNQNGSSKQTFAEFFLNIMYMIKIMLDAMMAVRFRVQYLDYNLQAPEIQQIYWKLNDPEAKNQSLDQQYAIRYIYMWIFMIKAGNAVTFILFPLILIYRNRFYLDDYIPRLFLVIGKLWKVLLYFLVMSVILLNVYNVINSLNYNSPVNTNGIYLDILEERISRVDVTRETGFWYRDAMVILIILIVLIMFWFGGNAIAQEDLIARRRLKADKLYNKAKEMYEGNFLTVKYPKIHKRKVMAVCCKKCINPLRFRKARYIIQTVQRQQVEHNKKE